MGFLSLLLATGDTPLTGIGQAVTAVMTWLVSLFTQVVPVFWDSADSTFTFIGWISIVLFSCGMAYGVLRFIRAMIRQ